MWSLLKKLISALVVLYLVALILNLKIGGRPTREWTQRAWQSPVVQKVYTTVKDRILALIRKDISVEEVFKSDLPQKNKASPSDPASAPASATAPAAKEEIKVIDIEQLDEKDRESLELILKKAAPNK